MTQRLSKSRFVAGVQCPKLLWWKVHEPDAIELQPDKDLQDKFDQGKEVGERAQKKFPQGVLIDLPHSGIMAVQAIQDAAERGHLIGDVPVLAIVGIVFIVLAPKSGETAVSGEGPG